MEQAMGAANAQVARLTQDLDASKARAARAEDGMLHLRRRT